MSAAMSPTLGQPWSSSMVACYTPCIVVVCVCVCAWRDVVWGWFGWGEGAVGWGGVVCVCV